MKRCVFYEAPEVRIIAFEPLSVLCSSGLSFGEDGEPGDSIFDEDDIWDGGPF